MSVRLAKTQMILGIRHLGSLATTYWVYREDCDQTGQSLRLAHTHFVYFVMSWLKYLFFMSLSVMEAGKSRFMQIW